MKYFTPDLIARLGSSESATFQAADAEWDRRLEAYEEQLRQFELSLPEHVREFNELLLHDAVVWSIARQGDKLLMVMRKDIPPRDVVILTYTLTAEPVIDKEALPPEDRSPVMDFMYDEFELVREGDRTSYAQSILFSNGWQMSLRFSDVQVTLADPVYAFPTARVAAAAAAVAVQSA